MVGMEKIKRRVRKLNLGQFFNVKSNLGRFKNGKRGLFLAKKTPQYFNLKTSIFINNAL